MNTVLQRSAYSNMTTTNAICTWDFTLRADEITIEDVKKVLKTNCKKWCFQKEQGEGGFVHYQGRISLGTKQRLPQAKASLGFESIHLSPTSNENRDNTFYVMKDDTRVEGPWKDTDKQPLYIQKRFRGEIVLKPWQEQVKAFVLSQHDDRHIHVIYDIHGNQGKSFMAGYLEAHCNSYIIDYNGDDPKDIMRQGYDGKDSTTFIIDLPRTLIRAFPPLKIYQLYMSIEKLKDGRVREDRNVNRKERIEPPFILIFTNYIPDVSVLSYDRWKVFKINTVTELLEDIPLEEIKEKQKENKRKRNIVEEEEIEY